jgi:hypothetical protein
MSDDRTASFGSKFNHEVFEAFTMKNDALKEILVAIVIVALVWFLPEIVRLFGR